MVVPSKLRNQNCHPVDTFLRRIRIVQTELSGNMLSLRMHLDSHFQSGGMVTPNVSGRMVRSLRGEGVQRK